MPHRMSGKSYFCTLWRLQMTSSKRAKTKKHAIKYKLSCLKDVFFCVSIDKTTQILKIHPIQEPTFPLRLRLLMPGNIHPIS